MQRALKEESHGTRAAVCAAKKDTKRDHQMLLQKVVEATQWNLTCGSHGITKLARVKEERKREREKEEEEEKTRKRQKVQFAGGEKWFRRRAAAAGGGGLRLAAGGGWWRRRAAAGGVRLAAALGNLLLPGLPASEKRGRRKKGHYGFPNSQTLKRLRRGKSTSF